MATTFGIINRELEQDDWGNIVEDIDDGLFARVALRNRGGICWLYPFDGIAHALSDSTRVYPLDNTAQGIYTIGDIRRETEEQEKNED